MFSVVPFGIALCDMAAWHRHGTARNGQHMQSLLITLIYMCTAIQSWVSRFDLFLFVLAKVTMSRI